MCLFWDTQYAHKESRKDAAMGTCMRYPPNPYSDKKGSSVVNVTTSPADWCGEFINFGDKRGIYD